MKKLSAGILMYRLINQKPEFLLAHMGGPFHKRRENGAWTIPKGEPDPDEDLKLAAIREFREETGEEILGTLIPLQPVRQKSGKEIHCWAVKGNFDPDELVSNTFSMEWPPGSGKFSDFQEIDRVEWFDEDQARLKIIPEQWPLIEELLSVI